MKDYGGSIQHVPTDPEQRSNSSGDGPSDCSPRSLLGRAADAIKRGSNSDLLIRNRNSQAIQNIFD